MIIDGLILYFALQITAQVWEHQKAREARDPQQLELPL